MPKEKIRKKSASKNTVRSAALTINERELLSPDLDPDIRFEAAPARVATADDDAVAAAVGLALLGAARAAVNDAPAREERPWAMLARSENLRYR